MRNKAIEKRLFGFLTSAIILLLTPAAQAKILIDFGNNISYRCHETTNPDSNGNYWNSVYSGAYYSNLLNADGTANTIDFGFGSAPGVDSYNGPAGDTSAQGTPNGLYVNAVIDATALGDLGIKSAVFDYYVSSTFTIQQLDSTKVYDLTFFGSHKYNTDNTTVYTVYTANDYATTVASVSLLVGNGSAHNQNTVATIKNVAPQTSNSIWIGFKGSAGSLGYLNAMRINEITPDGTWNGSGANNDTMTDANWTSGRYPAAVASGVMRFAGSTRTTPNVNYAAGSAFGSIYFNSGAAAFAVAGNALTLHSLIENDSDKAQTISNNLTMGAAISLKATVAGGSLTLAGSLNNSGYTLTADNAYAITNNGVISGNGSVVKSSAGMLTLSGVNTYTGKTTINLGTISIAAETGLGGNPVSPTADQLYLNGGTLKATATFAIDDANRGITIGTADGTCEVDSSRTLTINEVIAGGAGCDLTKSGAGILNLSRANTYGGATTISAGTLQLGTAGVIPDASSVPITSGAVFDLNGNNETIYALTLNGTGISSGGALVNSSGTAATLTLGATSSLASDSSVGGSGDITIGGAVAIFNSTPRTLTKVGNNTLTLSNGANVDNQDLLLAVSAGTVVLNKTGTAASPSTHCIGGLSVASGGTVKLSGSGGYQVYERAATPTINNGGVLDMNGQNQTFNTPGLTISGTGISSGGALVNDHASSASILYSKLIMGADSSVGGSGTLTISDVISGSSKALTKVGTGTLILSGNNTYSGATTVNAGTLAGTGCGSSATTVNSATLAPGTSGIGTFNTAALAMNTGSSMDWEYNDTTADKVAAAGTLTLATSANAVTIKVKKTGTAVNGEYTLFTFTGTAPSLTGLKFDLTEAPGVTSASAYPSDQNIMVTLLPEPGVIVLEAMLLLAIRGSFTLKGRTISG